MGVTKITTFPNQKVDYMWIKNGTANQALIDSTYVAGFIPTFDNGTLALANYNDGTLDAGNILDIPVDIEFWSVFRRQGTVIEEVGRFPASTTEIYDYMVGNKSEYDYLIFPETSSLAGSPITSNMVNTKWWNWSIISYNEPEDGKHYSLVDEVWMFDLDIETAPLTQNLNRNVYKGYTKFPKISEGQLNYLSGSVSSLLGNFSCQNHDYQDTVEMQEAFSEFINNGKKKILKSRKGNVWICETMSNNFKMSDTHKEQQTSIGFEFVEVASTDDISVVSLSE